MIQLRTLLPLFLAASSCDAPQPAQPKTAAPAPEIPKHLCDEAKAAWEKLQSDAGLVPGDPAMIDHEAWLQMGEVAQTRVGQVLAVNGACGAATPTAEQAVEIRSDTGIVLMKRTFDLTGADAALTHTLKSE